MASIESKQGGHENKQALPEFLPAPPPSADGLETKETSCGVGVFATQAFGKGDIVVPGVLVRDLGDRNHSHASQVGEHHWIQHGGFQPYVNHSCDSACGIQVNEDGTHSLKALRDIAEGDEVTLDYSLRNYDVGCFSKCLCGSAGCRGGNISWKNMNAAQRAKYLPDLKEFVAPYLLALP
mmetsp:Transcript_3565/g.4177  ORF Transcript_3565/g.4177 Transcript_3565/m.4177 type:complete len:180 (-) Transcript_3565:108-647(-)|eukprot:CAMPEP_0205819746 /NCGR_PEP_ID=MMETSP0206-20130828/2209_1 /ASSEMBLY_ACC=CAM_ASM_000279 /TAXON_ID=36767 /ORGANISM="Euplotes focardii, Strain TN1" /LENGTH=179 /DNA_ID=CAMNT_0053113667 /DNA_START=221 /DNA_END=760 /DNA_ORIENTATION=+